MEKEIILVAGLGFGDEGKGSVVDYLARTKNAIAVARYNGGAQAGHNVVTPEGIHHTFSQFGSGMLVDGVKTHLSRFMIINPLSMVREEEYLGAIGIKDAFRRTTIDEETLITTPFQIAVNRLLEMHRGEKRHGSCGMGIGQTVKDHQSYGDLVLFAKDMLYPEIAVKKMEFLRKISLETVRDIALGLPQTEAVKKEMDWLEDKQAAEDLAAYFYHFTALIKIVGKEYLAGLLENSSPLIFEGAQGALLDRKYGFHPYVTKTDTTFANANRLLKEAGYRGKITKVGVLRAYATRHGAGPFPTEDKNLTEMLKDEHNASNQWQGNFRIGWLDIPSAKYAIAINNGVDYLAMTNIDRLSALNSIKVRTGSGFLEFPAWQDYVNFLQSKEGLNCPIKILSFGPTWKDKIWRR